MNYKYLLVLIFLAGLIFSSCSNKKKAGEKPEAIHVKVFDIKQETIPEILQFSGNILPLKTIKFGFMVAGKIKDVYIKEGQYIYKGDPIATIDPVDYEFAFQASEAQFLDAEKEFIRLTNLYNKGSLTQSDYDKISALYKEAKADYQYKKKQLEDTHLYSPHDGLIAVKGVEPGEVVPQGMPLFGIVYTKVVYAEAAIPENEINLISLNKNVFVNVPALNDSLFNAKISRIGPVADPYARSFPVKASIQNPDLILKPGMIAFLHVPTGRTGNIIKIPAEAVEMEANGQTYIYLLNQEKNTVTKKNIQTYKAHGNGVEVIDGLKEGDIIVVEGNEKLYNNAKIIIK
ncbi:MAG: efflux RND transporter periplasmic adaptor subunit [Bacteroidales bacterium]|nr:efflux RND transporter periplasmic adaptor subunit [Bacteroidales bacterium]